MIVEVRSKWFRGDLGFLDKLQQRIAHLIRDEVLLRPHPIKLVEPGSIPKSRKAKPCGLSINERNRVPGDSNDISVSIFMRTSSATSSG